MFSGLIQCFNLFAQSDHNHFPHQLPLIFLATDVINVEKFSPSPGIEPETFCNLGRCSNH